MADTISSLMTERLDLAAQMKLLQERMDENEEKIKDLHQGNSANDWVLGAAKVKAIPNPSIIVINLDKDALAAKVEALKALTE